MRDLIVDEPVWRADPRLTGPDHEGDAIAITRWRSHEARPREVAAETACDRHVVAIALRSMSCRFAVAGRTVHDGIVAAGMIHVTEPGVSARCLFRGPYDLLHLHVPNALIAACGRELAGGPVSTLPTTPGPIREPVIERLATALLGAEEIGAPFGPRYADCVSRAIVMRLLAIEAQSVCETRAAAEPRRRVAALPAWRLKRAVEYVEARLAEPVSLGELAAATGITRMHFAAQFRAATGLRPHEYVLRRRVERAQEMLVANALPLAEIALAVGFQTQAHFTTVFKRFVGRPPHAWRRALGYADRPVAA